MSTTRKTPKLRFPEFTGDWEQRKLSDYLFTSKEKNVNNKYERKDVYSVSGEFGVVNQIEFQGRSFAGKTLDGYDVIHKGEVVYTKSPLKSNPYGIIKTNKRETGIVSTLYAVYKTKDTCFANFVEDYFNSDSRTNRYLSTLISKGAKNTINVSDEKALDGIVIFPSTEEQRKISTYFEKLNNLITLHQRELDSLKKLKKSLLQKMFPKNGEKIPELRFPEFTGDWEQRELGEIAEKVTKKNSNLEISETFTNSAEQGIISQKDFFDHKVASSENIGNYYVVDKNDFVYNPRISTTAPVGPINRNRLGRAGVMSPLYTVFRAKDINQLFLEWYFKSSCWHLFMYFNGDSGARSDRFSIKDSVFFSMPIFVPSKEEQFKIGRFFDQLNETITLHQRELDTLKKLKKGLLQNMFV